MILPVELVSLFVVHGGGLILDLTAGYLLFFDVTRPYAMFFVSYFHCMNSQLFSIGESVAFRHRLDTSLTLESLSSALVLAGMFPYTMLATTPMFCYVDWPRRFFSHFPSFLTAVLPFTTPEPQPSASCIYPEVQSRSSDRRQTPPDRNISKPRFKHKLGAIFTVVYILEQLFMPYSHFITKVSPHSLNTHV